MSTTSTAVYVLTTWSVKQLELDASPVWGFFCLRTCHSIGSWNYWTGHRKYHIYQQFEKKMILLHLEKEIGTNSNRSVIVLTFMSKHMTDSLWSMCVHPFKLALAAVDCDKWLHDEQGYEKNKESNWNMLTCSLKQMDDVRTFWIWRCCPLLHYIHNAACDDIWCETEEQDYYLRVYGIPFV